MIERRKHTRSKTPVGITYKLADQVNPAEPISTFVRDLSAGGVSFMVKDELRSGALLEIKIQIPQLDKPVYALSEVVWCAPSKEGEQEVWDVGARFSTIEPEDLRHLIEYMHKTGVRT